MSQCTNWYRDLLDFQPATGVLGTHSKAVVYEMLMEGKLYPKGYLWQIERVSPTHWYNYV